MTSICAVITSRNRPDFLAQTIKSLINQSRKADKIIVSDNSNKDITKIKKLELMYPEIKFIYNSGKFNMPDHYSEILKNCEHDLLCICHDDDIFLYDYISEIYTANSLYKNSILYGINGRSFYNANIDKKLIWNYEYKYISINSLTLLTRWFDHDHGGIAPVSGIVFNMNLYNKFIPKIFPSYLEGKNYWDTFFFARLSKEHPILWVNKDLIRYRIHHQSTSSISVFDYKIAYNIMKTKFFYDTSLDKSIKIYRKLHFLIMLIEKKKFFNSLLGLKISVFLFFNSKYFRKILFIYKIIKYIKKLL